MMELDTDPDPDFGHLRARKKSPCTWFTDLWKRILTTFPCSRRKAEIHLKNSRDTDQLKHLFSVAAYSDISDKDLSIIKHADLPTIFILAGPGAPTQALINRVASIYNFHHVIVGEILREEIILGTGLGEMVHKLMHRGVVLPRQFLNEIIKRDMAEAITTKNVKGFLFSDYPTTYCQAKTFIQKIQKVDYIIVFKFDEKTMKLNAFQQLRRQSLSSKSLYKTKEELKEDAEKRVASYNKDLILLFQLCGHTLKLIDGQLQVTEAYHEIMKWIERAMVLHNSMPPFLPDPPINLRKFSNESADSGDLQLF